MTRLSVRAGRHAAPPVVPHFVALLGVLREAARRGLALLPDAPAARRFPRVGKRKPRFFQPLERVRTA